MFDETKLFCDWYVPKILSKSKSIQFKKKFRLEIKKLLSKLNYKNVTFVHRDFHVYKFDVSTIKNCGNR